MARYDFQCGKGHVSEAIFPMAEVPASTPCTICGRDASRMFSAPTVHYKGPGFYATDVTGRLHRRRRKNAGDDLHREFDTTAARIADAI